MFVLLSRSIQTGRSTSRVVLLYYHLKDSDFHRYPYERYNRTYASKKYMTKQLSILQLGGIHLAHSMHAVSARDIHLVRYLYSTKHFLQQICQIVLSNAMISVGFSIFSLTSRFCFCPPFKIRKVNSKGQALVSLAKKGVNMPSGITHYFSPMQIKVVVFLSGRLQEEILILFWSRQGAQEYAQVGA